MPSALVPLANLTLGSTASTVTFSSISGSYRDIRLIVSAKDNASQPLKFRFNGDTGTNYNLVEMDGDGSATGSASAANISVGFFSYNYSALNATNFSVCTMDVMDYSATDKHKIGLIRVSDASQTSGATAIRWASTSAITSLTLVSQGAFQVGSTFALYGTASA